MNFMLSWFFFFLEEVDFVPSLANSRLLLEMNVCGLCFCLVVELNYYVLFCVCGAYWLVGGSCFFRLFS